MAKCDHALSDRCVDAVTDDAVDERAIQLDRVEVDATQICERRVSSAEVVEREQNPDRLEAPNDVDGCLGVLHGCGLRDLEHQLTGTHSSALKQLDHFPNELGAQLHGREVH